MNIERERGKCKYPLLFQPLKVNKIVLKNRIISAPLGSNTDKSLSGIGMISEERADRWMIRVCV